MNDDKKTDTNKLQMWLCRIIGKLQRDASTIIAILGIFIFFVFLAVLFSNYISGFFKTWLGINGRKEILEFLGWGIGGIIASYGLLSLNKRADAQAKSAAAQVETNRLAEIGLFQDRFKVAVEHLSNQELSARIASFYEFFHLAKDKKYIESILDIFCAHLRHISSSIKSEEDPPEEIKTLIGILFSEDAVDIFGELDYNLQRVNLNGINFQKMHKPKGKVDFSSANLINANLIGRNLSGFNLFKTNLKRAFLVKANLEKTSLIDAILESANLSEANLKEANLWDADLNSAFISEANLQEANLKGANLQGAFLRESDLRGANLKGANLQKTFLREADLRGADLQGADLQETFLLEADLRGADLQETGNLETATLSKAKYNDETKFPEGFVPENTSMRYCLPDNDKE